VFDNSINNFHGHLEHTKLRRKAEVRFGARARSWFSPSTYAHKDVLSIRVINSLQIEKRFYVR